MLPLYDKVESLCRGRGLNITQMCKDTGVPRSALSDYKAGRVKSISTDKLAKIAAYFNVSIDYLLGSSEEQFYSESTSKIICDKIKDAHTKHSELFDGFIVPHDIWQQIDSGTYRFSSVTFPQFSKVIGEGLESILASGAQKKAPSEEGAEDAETAELKGLLAEMSDDALREVLKFAQYQYDKERGSAEKTAK